MLFFERPGWGESAILVHCIFFDESLNNELEELKLLAESAGADVKSTLTCKRQEPKPGLFIGSGKLEELKALVESSQAELVLFNHNLSAIQNRNIEKALCCRVVDRTGLILDIFAQRARTYEGKLQVELAQLEHLSTRLVRGWTHLERQKGGIGLRGPGETQLESDRRMVRQRISSLKQKLVGVRSQRLQSRRSRTRANTPLVVLVGYTNVGKSSLFNKMTASEIYAEDQLFATLDTTLRRIAVPGIGDVVIADTVGFVRNLPHALVDAFRASLEEVLEADLILEVVDANERRTAVFHEKKEAVAQVLKEVGADQVPRLQVYNKIDLSGDEARLDQGSGNANPSVWVSASTGAGAEMIPLAIAESLKVDWFEEQIQIDHTNWRLRSELYRQKAVVREYQDSMGETFLDIKLPSSKYAYILKHFG